MKKEVRVLLSHCNTQAEYCIGIIARGRGVDGIVSGHNCEELCSELVYRGYIGNSNIIWDPALATWRSRLF
jgi:hypothetical protein